MRFLPMLGAFPLRDVDEGESWVACAAVLVLRQLVLKLADLLNP